MGRNVNACILKQSINDEEQEEEVKKIDKNFSFFKEEKQKFECNGQRKITKCNLN